MLKTDKYTSQKVTQHPHSQWAFGISLLANSYRHYSSKVLYLCPLIPPFLSASCYSTMERKSLAVFSHCPTIHSLTYTHVHNTGTHQPHREQRILRSPVSVCLFCFTWSPSLLCKRFLIIIIVSHVPLLSISEFWRVNVSLGF